MTTERRARARCSGGLQTGPAPGVKIRSNTSSILRKACIPFSPAIRVSSQFRNIAGSHSGIEASIRNGPFQKEAIDISSLAFVSSHLRM